MLVAGDAQLTLGETPAGGGAHRDVLVVTPDPGVDALRRPVPRVDRGADGGTVVVVEGHEHVRVVMAGGEETGPGAGSGAAEQRAKGAAAADGRSDAGAVVDQALLGEELGELVVQLVIDEIRVAMDEIDDLVLVHQPSHVAFEVRARSASAQV